MLAPKMGFGTANIGSSPDARAERRAYVSRLLGTDQEGDPHAASRRARTIPKGLHIPAENGGTEFCRTVVERNADEGVR